MILNFRRVIISCILCTTVILFTGCPTFSDTEEPFPAVEDQMVIKAVLAENGISTDNFRNYLTLDYGESGPNGYWIYLKDSTITKLILSDTINQLINSKQFRGIIGSNTNIAEIIVHSNSTIVMPELDLMGCKLRSIPSDISKIRTRRFLFSSNNATLTAISEDMIGMGKQPACFDKLILHYDGVVENLSGISDSLRTWLWDHSDANRLASYSVGE